MSTDTRPAETVPLNLIQVCGKALYGWSDDEPNEASGYEAVYEATKVAAMVHSAGYRLPDPARPAPEVVEALEDSTNLLDSLTGSEVNEFGQIDGQIADNKKALAAYASEIEQL